MLWYIYLHGEQFLPNDNKNRQCFPDKKKAAELDDNITLGGVTPHRPPLFLIWNTYLQIIL